MFIPNACIVSKDKSFDIVLESMTQLICKLECERTSDDSEIGVTWGGDNLWFLKN